MTLHCITQYICITNYCGFTILTEYSATYFLPDSSVCAQIHEMDFKCSCTCVIGELATLPPALGDYSLAYTQDHSVSVIPGMGSQSRQLISGSQSNSFKYLGLRFRSDLEVLCPADHLLNKLQQDLTVFSSHILVTPRNFQSLLSLLNFLAPLVVLGHLHMCLLQF